mmetsp:Transcript_22734/g.73116  ORF Transcript_22734/g.73116 Transcript_22734/m.73116 type:complete len:271 (-) Transcript_22734:1186-1998(-)
MGPFKPRREIFLAFLGELDAEVEALLELQLPLVFVVEGPRDVGELLPGVVGRLHEVRRLLALGREGELQGLDLGFQFQRLPRLRVRLAPVLLRGVVPREVLPPEERQLLLGVRRLFRQVLHEGLLRVQGQLRHGLRHRERRLHRELHRTLRSRRSRRRRRSRSRRRLALGGGRIVVVRSFFVVVDQENAPCQGVDLLLGGVEVSAEAVSEEEAFFSSSEVSGGARLVLQKGRDDLRVGVVDALLDGGARGPVELVDGVLKAGVAVGPKLR